MSRVGSAPDPPPHQGASPWTEEAQRGGCQPEAREPGLERCQAPVDSTFCLSHSTSVLPAPSPRQEQVLPPAGSGHGDMWYDSDSSFHLVTQKLSRVVSSSYNSPVRWALLLARLSVRRGGQISEVTDFRDATYKQECLRPTARPG